MPLTTKQIIDIAISTGKYMVPYSYDPAEVEANPDIVKYLAEEGDDINTVSIEFLRAFASAVTKE